MNLVTIIPESLRTEGNNAACIFGLSMADKLTFDLAPTVTKDAVQYRWCNAQMSAEKLASLSAPLSLPAHNDGSLNLASAQALLDAAVTITNLDGVPPSIVGKLVLAPNVDAQVLLEWLGLVNVDD